MAPVSVEELDGIRRWFVGYSAGHVRGVGPAAEMARVVAEHSAHVRQESLLLAKDLGMESPAAALAGVLGLLHDVGRFEQEVRFSFFEPHRARHAERSVHVLDREDVLRPLPEPVQHLVRRSILRHGEDPRDPADDDETVLFFTRLLQDADKLDNWRIALREYEQVNGHRNPALRHGLIDSPGCSLRVRDQVMAGLPVNPHDLRNLNDLRLFQLGWLFSIHFPETLRHVHARATIDGLRHSLHGCGNTDALFAAVKRTVESGRSEQ
jgi:hypothetical protein